MIRIPFEYSLHQLLQLTYDYLHQLCELVRYYKIHLYLYFIVTKPASLFFAKEKISQFCSHFRENS